MSVKTFVMFIRTSTRSFKSHHRAFALAAALFALVPAACDRSQHEEVSHVADTIWVGTWATAQQLVEPRNMPPEPGLSNNTLRQVVHVSLGGDRLRAKFSNAYSSRPITLNAVHIAASAVESAIDPDTDVVLSFNGNPKVTIEPATEVVSDPFQFALTAGSNVTFTIYYGDTSPDVTGHPGSRTTSYIAEGNAVSALDLSEAIQTDHWYTISGIDVQAAGPAAAVVVLGDSITDGRGSGTNKQNRWPDELAQRLRTNAGTERVAVLNQGIGGNCILRDCLGPTAVNRFEHDVLEQSGVRWLIILEGINDIGQVESAEEATALASDLIAAYEQLIDRAHARDIRVYGATMTPFGTSFYDTPERIEAWKTVNKWIRNSGRFDAVIDFDAALRDPENPLRLLPAADTGDHLHPNETGYQMMAKAVNLSLFQNSGE